MSVPEMFSLFEKTSTLAFSVRTVLRMAMHRSDIAIEFPSPTSGNEGFSVSFDDTQIKKNLLYEGLKGLRGLLSYGVPLMKGLIDKARDELKTLASNKTQDASMYKMLFAEEKVTELKDLLDLYYDYLCRYGNDLPKMTEETKVFQRKFSEKLMRVKNAMTSGYMSSPSFKIWVNGAAFHIEMLIRLAQLTSEEDSHSVRQAILVYQQDLQQIIKCYRKFREDLLHARDIDAVTDPLSNVKQQIFEIEQHFSRLLERVDSLVESDATGGPGERINANGSRSGNPRTHHEGVKGRDDGAARNATTSNQNTSQDQCMFCGENGHKVEKCRLNVQCRTCSQWGHSSGSCPESRLVLECPICQEDHLGKDCPLFCGGISF